ncbi:SRPBCC family protein [Methanosarcina sp.]|uniref:SRPBCC family protein n=1 Tax=Methanosarcina sp. TaxID=2213 RepID=UPI003C7399DB
MSLVAANTSITQKNLQTEVVINASAARVWHVLTDFGAYPQWNPFIREVSGVAIPGERLKVQMHSGNRTMKFRPTILASRPERELRWLGHLLIPGIFDGEHSFVIEPAGENRVRLIQRETFDGLLVPFSGSLLHNTKQSFDKMNLALKERAEQAN